MSDVIEQIKWLREGVAGGHAISIAGTLEKQAKEIERLTAALGRLASPLAFTESRVATAEETARMFYAEEALAAVDKGES